TSSSANYATRSAASCTPARVKCSAISSARCYSDDNDVQFMKILVSFKSVPDPNEATLAGAAASAAKLVINPFDEIAIEEALRIRERGDAVEIVAVTIGAPAIEEQVRSALAMGV